MIHMNSTEMLQFIAENDCYILLEKGAPYTALKRDFISVRGPNSENNFSTPRGYSSSFEILRAVFDDYQAASFIEQDGLEDDQHRLIFRLTRTGREVALHQR